MQNIHTCIMQLRPAHVFCSAGTFFIVFPFSLSKHRSGVSARLYHTFLLEMTNNYAVETPTSISLAAPSFGSTLFLPTPPCALSNLTQTFHFPTLLNHFPPLHTLLSLPPFPGSTVILGMSCFRRSSPSVPRKLWP